MKIIALLCIAAIVYGDGISDEGGNALDTQTEEDLDSLLTKLADKIISLLKGNDPYTVQFTNINVNNKLMRVKGSIDKTSISDISSTKIEMHALKENNTHYIGCNVSINSLTIMGDYDLDLYLIEQVFITGRGKYGISLADTNLTTQIELSENDMLLKVNNFKFKYNIDEIQVDIAGLFQGGAVGELVENVLNDLIQKIVIDYNELISSIAAGLGESLLQRNIDGLSMKNVTSIIEEIIGV